ncbi:expressed unknown protein [Seminavis robusta]|uniref:Uncharacterized protein n=1 Tax=Seminavis robusta TaxID=568900 RepID=A0A9N8E6A3_9STRA|nr:expressed unknown protein [Seminavis robusta]|eukprot:Sro560_g033071.1  (78) ;mRNA; r:1296-1529
MLGLGSVAHGGCLRRLFHTVGNRCEPAIGGVAAGVLHTVACCMFGDESLDANWCLLMALPIASQLIVSQRSVQSASE